MRFLSIFVFVFFTSSACFGQAGKAIKGSKTMYAPLIAEQFGFITENRQWDVQLKSFAASANKSSVSDEELELLSRKPDAHGRPDISKLRNNPVKLNVNYEGNRGTGSVPPDNTLAVSTNGFVISGINSNLFFSRTDGTLILTQALSDFFTDLGLGGGYFDPRIIYDIPSQRFIIVALSGSKSDISHVCIAFSKGEDPSLGWNFYKLKGDLEGEDLWFDYPNIALTEKELYITGNMFTDANQFRYSSIYQISKENGYLGQALAYKSYAKMKYPNSDQNLFNLTPVSSGWTSHDDGGILFLTNDPRGENNIILLCQTSGTLNENPEFQVLDVRNGLTYNISPTAPQKGTTNKLQTGDCRIQYAVQLGDVIHFLLKAKVNDKAGLYLGRYDVVQKKLYTSVYAEDLYYTSYPSLAPMGNSPQDSRMLVQYLRSSSEIFPEQVAMVVEGTAADFQYGESMVIRDGDSFVNALDTENERWGDYSCVARRFFNGLPETWAAGCFGRVRFGTWIGQFIPADADFRDIFANKTVINPGDTITFSYKGTDTLAVWEWTTSGGSLIGTSSAQYDSLGSYNLYLRGVNTKGDSISIVKNNFIHVVNKVFRPEAMFEADKLTAFEGDTIQLRDLSSNQPTKWKWTLTGGTPSSSTEQNPTVVYAKKGQYNVVLNAKNSAGEDVEVKQKYIKVEARPVAPIVNFSADRQELIEGDSVQFTDMSSNQPTSWKWIISGPENDTIYEQNPLVYFNTQGSYDVSLTAGNAAGENTLSIPSYIMVGASSTADQPWIQTSGFYPNPVITDRFYFNFDLITQDRIQFDLYTANGGFVRMLLHKDVKAGRNEFSFNAEMLTAGNYLLHLTNKMGRKLTLPFTVLK